MAPQSGHVSNFCSLNTARSNQSNFFQTKGMRAELALLSTLGTQPTSFSNPSDRASTSRESGTGRKHYAVLREVDSMTGATIRYSW